MLLSVLAERRLQAGHTAELGSLLAEVLEPPIERIGALDVNDFLPLEERRSLAAALNTLLASPTFASWRQGVSLDIREWLTLENGRTPAGVVSVAHLDDEERTSCSACWRIGLSRRILIPSGPSAGAKHVIDPGPDRCAFDRGCRAAALRWAQRVGGGGEPRRRSVRSR